MGEQSGSQIATPSKKGLGICQLTRGREIKMWFFTRVLRCSQYRISVVMKHTRLCSSSGVIIRDNITRVTLCPRWDWQYGEEGWRKNNYLPLLLVGQLILCSNRRREGNYNLIKSMPLITESLSEERLITAAKQGDTTLLNR